MMRRAALAVVLWALVSDALQAPQPSARRALRPLESRTSRILEALETEGDGGGAGASGTLQGIRGLDGMWAKLRVPDEAAATPAPFVTEAAVACGGGAPDFDVVVLGGTLGVFAAAAFQKRGLRTCVVERGPLVGRNQEWNLSLDEVYDLVDAGALEADDVDGAIGTPGRYEVLAGDEGTMVASHFGSVRAGFNDREVGKTGSGGALQEVWLPSVLNVGVRPDVAVARARANFEARGGVVLEHTSCGSCGRGRRPSPGSGSPAGPPRPSRRAPRRPPGGGPSRGPGRPRPRS